MRADGADVALFDVEAVDAQGRVCPTFQQRVDFDIKGPGVWRGGYNSGKTNSINNTYLDLECGINRVAVRSTRQPGAIVLSAHCDGLTPASATVQAKAVSIENGMTSEMPAMPTPTLPPQRSTEIAFVHIDPSQFAPQAGKIIGGLFYSGPTDNVTIESDARNGIKAYVDADETMGALPSELAGAEWVRAAQGDKLYSAVDLMEISMTAGSTAYVAYDESLPTPDWIGKQRLKSIDKSIIVGGRKMKLYSRAFPKEGNMTLGSNSEDPKMAVCNMYLVFGVKSSEGQ
jgi:beta-galactosidase